MKYKGQELTEITEPQIFDPPKKMLVWDGGCDEPYERVVCAVAVDNCGSLIFIEITNYEQCQGVCFWEHCAEIPEEPKPRRATKQEFARWIAQGKGEWKNRYSEHVFVQWYSYREAEANEPCNETLVVRKWSDKDWHEPTADYLGLED